MKKSLQVAVCVIVLCSLLAVPLSLQSRSSPSHMPSQASQSQQNQSKPIEQTTQNVTSSTSSKPNVPLDDEGPSSNPQSQQTGLQDRPSYVDYPSNRTLREAKYSAISYLGQIQEPYALLLLNVLYRRFGITEFADSLQRYDQILAENPENAPLLRIFRRIANYTSEAQPGDFLSVTADVDKLTVPALYSDRSSLPVDYMSELNGAVSSGGYMLTHALLATIWLQDNHCDPGYDFRESVYLASAGLIDGDPVVTDLELEAAAFLYMAGQGTLVDAAFVQSAVAVQNLDGGWSSSSGTSESSNWHASVLGLMLLLSVEYPDVSLSPMLATDLS